MNLPPGKYYWDKEETINEKDITIHNIKHLQLHAKIK